MAVWLPLLRAGRTLPPGRFLVLISVRGWVDPRAVVRLEGLGKLKKKSASSELEPATFRLVECLNQLRYRMPPRNNLINLTRFCLSKLYYEYKEINFRNTKTGQVYQIICRFRPHRSSKCRSDVSTKHSDTECGGGSVSSINVNRSWRGWVLNTQTID
jgi:hypothetical protein